MFIKKVNYKKVLHNPVNEYSDEHKEYKFLPGNKYEYQKVKTKIEPGYSLNDCIELMLNPEINRNTTFGINDLRYKSLNERNEIINSYSSRVDELNKNYENYLSQLEQQKTQENNNKTTEINNDTKIGNEV